MDTGAVLQMREALALVDAELEAIDHHLADLTDKHGATR